ncbi:outer membrane protein transport protein (OMPP1/FadL/TodX) [Winogradskyella wandonensis]|uniref:Outer membrane protein transport protein (OMPP1/FadL/TodX) n=1 Tax=Winogradskyella wandonensis TaxID=1442586 RepID=A0A4R1KNH7_9FLAO|nr:outer membrane protein transport protein [Winogradskyella wandonensis]TCK66624.1 outer membrane protein transport protein (OMPP1/FadL/TodX) [Winogradskyella wandonensis]
MKKLMLLVISGFLVSIGNAQDFTDALRFAKDEIEGTARFKAMGGAFGALGGDLSAVTINPASSSIFNSSTASFSLGFNTLDNDVSYFGGPLSTKEDNVNLSQGGGVFVYKSNNPNNKWNKFSLGVAYDRTGNFDNNWVANGVNPNTSIAEYFRGYAQGLRLDEISAFPGESLNEAYIAIGSESGFENQQAFLGYESFILEPDVNTDENTIYTNNISGGNYNQRYALATSGYSGKMAFNISGQYNEKLNLGLNVNAHFLEYNRLTVFDESNSNASSTVTRVGFDNTLRTTGTGISFQIGSIYKLSKEFRVGLTYNSPTWFRVTDETTQFLQTTVDGFDDPIVINPNIITIFPEYKLRTPGKVTGSLAYVFEDKGLISFDYSRKDFGETIFRPTDDPFFSSRNSEMSQLLGVSNTYRLGGEYRYKEFSFRGGYRFEESPFNDAIFGGDLTTYSLGLGYKIGDFAIDVAFSQGQREQSEFLYSDAPTFGEVANIDSRITDVVLTLSFGI